MPAWASVDLETDGPRSTDPLCNLLRAVDWVREQGWRVALDDVGADDRVLALLPVCRVVPRE